MRIDLTDDEARALRTMLQDYLPRLRNEIARTDSYDYRHDLIPRQDLCERLLGMLEDAPR
jgi:hypothetical protein